MRVPRDVKPSIILWTKKKLICLLITMSVILSFFANGICDTGCFFNIVFFFENLKIYSGLWALSFFFLGVYTGLHAKTLNGR